MQASDLRRADDVTEDGLADTDVADDGEEFVFLTVGQVMDLHAEGIRRYSPTESPSLRDYGLLESAVMAPQQTFGGRHLYPTLTEMAAAYLISLALNHAYENGNKRVAFAACSVFLRVNGYRLTLSQDEAVDLTLRVISHELSREEVVRILDNGIAPI